VKATRTAASAASTRPWCVPLRACRWSAARARGPGQCVPRRSAACVPARVRGCATRATAARRHATRRRAGLP